MYHPHECFLCYDEDDETRGFETLDELRLHLAGKHSALDLIEYILTIWRFTGQSNIETDGNDFAGIIYDPRAKKRPLT